MLLFYNVSTQTTITVSTHYIIVREHDIVIQDLICLVLLHLLPFIRDYLSSCSASFIKYCTNQILPKDEHLASLKSGRGTLCFEIFLNEFSRKPSTFGQHTATTIKLSNEGHI